MAAELFYASNYQINLRLPAQSVVGTSRSIATLTATVRINGTESSGPFSFVAYSWAPSLIFVGYDCYIDSRYTDWGKNCGLSSLQGNTNRAWRGAIADLKGNLLDSSNPARIGSTYTIWATGLGRFFNGAPAEQFYIVLSNVPVYGYQNPTYLPHVSPDYVGPSAQFPGLYQINFMIPVEIVTGNAFGYPPAWPCGEYKWELSIYLTEGSGLAENDSALMDIPVVIHPGDAPCSN